MATTERDLRERIRRAALARRAGESAPADTPEPDLRSRVLTAAKRRVQARIPADASPQLTADLPASSQPAAQDQTRVERGRRAIPPADTPQTDVGAFLDQRRAAPALDRRILQEGRRQGLLQRAQQEAGRTERGSTVRPPAVPDAVAAPPERTIGAESDAVRRRRERGEAGLLDRAAHTAGQSARAVDEAISGGILGGSEALLRAPRATLADFLGQHQRAERIRSDPNLVSGIGRIRRVTKDLASRAPYDERMEGAFIEDTLLPGAAGMGAYLAGGFLGRGIGLARAALPTSMAALGGADRAYREAVDAGLEPGEAANRAYAGTIPGLVQVATPISILHQLDRRTGGSIRNRAMEALRSGGMNAANEAVVNSLGEVGFNVIGDRDWDEDLTRAFLEGGAIGGFTSAAAQLAAPTPRQGRPSPDARRIHVAGDVSYWFDPNGQAVVTQDPDGFHVATPEELSRLVTLEDGPEMKRGGSFEDFQPPRAGAPEEAIGAAAPETEATEGRAPATEVPARAELVGEPQADPADRLEVRTEASRRIRRRLADLIDPSRREEVTAAQEQRDVARREAETDELTGIGNRRAFERARQTADADANVEVVAFDINNLKAANDILGHEAGDAVIRDAARAIEEAAGGRAFRIGGDEFVAVIEAGRGAEAAQAAEAAFGERPAGDFAVSLSGAAAQTYADADRAAQARKEERREPFRPQFEQGRPEAAGAQEEARPTGRGPLDVPTRQAGLEASEVFPPEGQRTEADPSYRREYRPTETGARLRQARQIASRVNDRELLDRYRKTLRTAVRAEADEAGGGFRGNAAQARQRLAAYREEVRARGLTEPLIEEAWVEVPDGEMSPPVREAVEEAHVMDDPELEERLASAEQEAVTRQGDRDVVETLHALRAIAYQRGIVEPSLGELAETGMAFEPRSEYGEEAGRARSRPTREGVAGEGETGSRQSTLRDITATFGSATEARRTTRELVKRAGPLVEISIPGTQATAERIQAVREGKEAAYAWVPATGHVIASEGGSIDQETMFRLLRAYRHPSAEYFQILVLAPNAEGQMEVAHHRMTSVGMLDMTLANAGDVTEAAAIARRLEGKVVLAHNHPSGDPTPSAEDVQVTQRLADVALRQGAQFGGHYVINGENAVLIANDGSRTPIHLAAEEGVRDWNRPGAGRVSGPQSLFDYLSPVAVDGSRLDVILLNSRNEVIAFEARPIGDLETIGEWLVGLRRDAAASAVLLGTGSEAAYTNAIAAVSGVPGLGVLDIADTASGRTAVQEKRLEVGSGDPTMEPVFERSGVRYGETEDVRGTRDRAESAAGPGWRTEGAVRGELAGEGFDALRSAVRETGRRYAEDAVDDGPEGPPRAGPPEPESRREVRERLEKNRRHIRTLAQALEGRGRRFQRDAFVQQAEPMVTGALVPKQAQQIMERARSARTPAEARRALERAERYIERELHRRAVQELQSVLRRANTAKMRPEFLEKIQATAEDIDLKAMGAKTRRTLQATARYLEDNPDAPVPDAIRRQLSRLDQTQLKQLSVEEVEALTDAVKAAVHLNRTKNRLLGQRRRRNREEVSSAAISEMEKRVKDLKRTRERATGLEGAPKRSKLGLFLKEVGTRPEVLLEHLSPTLRDLVWEDITVQAHATEQRQVWRYRDSLAAVIEKIGHKLGTGEFERWRSESLDLQTQKGSVQVTRDEAIWLRTTLKDPSNLGLALRNGITIDRSDRRVEITPEITETLDVLLDDGAIQISDAMFEQFNGPMKKDLNEAWVEVFGHEVARVPDYAPRSIDMDRADTGKDAMEQMAIDRDAALTTWGHLRERVGSSAPLKIGSALDTYANHSEHVARLSAYLAPASNAYTILGRADVKQAMLRRIGKQGYDRIMNSIQMQTVRNVDKSDAERHVRFRLGRFGASVLGLRISTLLLNPSGLAISAAYQENGFANLSRSLGAVRPAEWKRIEALAKKHSPYWRSRYETFVHQTTSGMASEVRRSYGGPDLAELSLTPLQKSDQFGATIRWRMAELHVQETQKSLQEGSDAYYAEVAREWERLMFRGENTAHGGDMTGALALGRRNVFFGPFVMFTSSVSKIYSLAARASFQLQRGEYQAAAKSMAGVFGSMAWAGLVREIMRSMRGSADEDEEIWDRTVLRMATEATNLVPIFGQSVLAPVLAQLAGKPPPMYSASVIDDALGDMGMTAATLVRTIQTGINGELDAQGEEVWKRHAQRALIGSGELLAAWFGVPFGGPRDAARMAVNLASEAPADVRRDLREMETEADVTQERRELLGSIRQNDAGAFRGAIREMRTKGITVSESDVLATINRRYGWLTKYEPGKPERDTLPPRTLMLIDQHLEERDHLRQLAENLARQNRDLVGGAQTGRGESRRTISRQPVRRQTISRSSPR